MNKSYRLATDGTYGIRLISGPLMTLSQAESYAAQLRFAGHPVLVVNINAI